MPIYDYKCSDCEHQIEVIQKISDKPKVACPKCNKKTLKKLISDLSEGNEITSS